MTISYQFSRAMHDYLIRGNPDGLRDFKAIDKNNRFITIRASNATDMNITTAVDGGYLDPVGMYKTVIAKRTEINLADKLGVQKFISKGTTVDVPIDNEADGEWVETAEASASDQDAPALAQASMTLKGYSKHTTLSVELFEDEDANLMQFLTEWAARGQAKTYNQLLLAKVAANGTLYKTAASPTAIVAGELEQVAWNDTLEPYLDDTRSCAWVMKPNTYGKIKSIEGDSRLYGGSDALGGGRSLLEYPVYTSQKAGAMTAGLKPVYFGNWYQVAQREAPGFTLLKDPYSNANLGQVVLWMYFRTVFAVLQPDTVGYLAMHT